MRITHLKLLNWRNFKSVDVAVGERLFVFGPNASGKSNLLDALWFLRDLAKPGGGLANAVNDRQGIRQIRNHFSRNHNRSVVTLGVTIGDADGLPRWRYTLGITARKGSSAAVIKQERVEKKGEAGWGVILDRPDKADELDDERLTQTALEQISANAEFREVADFLCSILFVHPDPNLIREPRIESSNGIDFGDSFLAGIARVNPRSREARLRRVVEALSAAVPQILGLEIDRDDDGRPHLVATIENFRAKNVKQNERDLSDGTLRLVAILWALTEPASAGGPLLLEEPEISLHRELVRRLPHLLARAAQKSRRQAIVTTHADDLLEDDGVGLREVLILDPKEEGSVAVLAADIPSVADGYGGPFMLRELLEPKLVSKQLSLFGQNFGR